MNTDDIYPSVSGGLDLEQLSDNQGTDLQTGSPQSTAINILLVEDSPDDALLLQRTLSKEEAIPFKVTHVVQLADALKRLTQENFDLVLLDFVLPDSMGLDTFTSIIAEAPHIPIIILSGLDDEALAIKALGLGAQDYLVKGGVDSNLLVRSIRYAIQRKRVENENARLLTQVEQQRKRLDNIVASVPGLVWEAWGRPDEANQQIDFVSSYVQTMLGYSVDEWLSTPNFWLTIVHPDDKEEAGRVAGERFMSGKGGLTRFRWITKDGRTIWAEAQSVVIKDADGAPIGMRGVTMDVSERKRREEEAQEHEKRFRAIFENTLDAMLIADDQGCYIDANPAACELFNLTEEELLTRSVLDVSQPDQRAATQQSWQQFLKEGEQKGEFQVMRPDGQVRDLEYSAKANFVPGYHLSVLRDVTERKRLDQQKDEFIALASHELKTPVTAIKGYAQIGLRWAGERNDEKLARALRAIDQQTDRISRLLNELLDVSRIHGGELTLHREDFDLSELVREVISSFEMTAPGFTFDVSLPSELCMVHADRQRIEQVMINLAQNAIKYSEDPKRIEVTVMREGGEAVVAVRDFGVGIPAEEQGFIFQRYFRASNVPSSMYSGLGLGLFIAHGIIARHHGRMWLESAEGQGSAFYFSLPVA